MSRKLLLADDSITIQKVIGITFVNEDFDLSVVGDGDAALEKARAERPDLILADVFMPGKNGYELCAAVKSDPALSKIPVLLLTGTFEPFDEDKAGQAGADGWIAKPFESQTLINRVQELLGKVEVEPRSTELPRTDKSEREITAVGADLWEELDETTAPAATLSATSLVVDEEPEEVDFGDILEADAEKPGVATTVDDVWDTVSFDDEVLTAETLSPEKTDVDDILASGENVVTELPEVGDEDPFEAMAVADESESVFEGQEGIASESEDHLVFSEKTSAETIEPVAVSGDDLLAFADEPLMEATEVVEPSDEDDLMDLSEDDILLLDEVEIFDEEEPIVETYDESDEGVPLLTDTDFIAPAGEALADSTLVDEDFFGGIVTTPGSETVSPESGLMFSEPEPLVFEPDSMDNESDESEGMVPESESLFVEPEAAPEFETEFETGIGESESAIPVIETEIAGGPEIRRRVAALSDEELSAIVEKVAGVLIERLAGSILEKIAWEVVPDLAETLIKEELHQIKEGARLSA